MFRDWLEKRDIDPSDVDDLVLALDEAASNAVSHGAVTSPRTQITIHASQVEQVILLSVTDQGRWIRPQHHDGQGKVSGRGLEIIGMLVDGVEIRPGENGTRISMHKRVGIKHDRNSTLTSPPR